MLSYRHAFHAGNHADILKHFTLTLILNALTKKEKPFTVFDTHGGAGIYQLDDERLIQTGEAESGILKLLSEIDFQDNIPQELKSYIELCKKYNNLGLYPGSPEIERITMRNQDKLFIAELHNTEINNLKGNLACSFVNSTYNQNPSITVEHINGFEMLKSKLPPLIKRGLIICDPSYETSSDYTETPVALEKAMLKWNTGIIALWYPLLSHRVNELAKMKNQLQTAIKNSSRGGGSFGITVEMEVEPVPTGEKERSGLYGSGMLVINPPYTLQSHLEESLPFITKALSEKYGKWNIEEL